MKGAFLVLLIFCYSCQSKQESITPVVQSITESVYASGLIKSKDQYRVFSVFSGIVGEVFVDEGTQVEIGSPILFIDNDAQKLIAENSKLSAEFNALSLNQGKIEEANSLVELTKNQMKNDLLMLERQKRLWAQNIGTKMSLEQKELIYESSKTNHASAQEKLASLKRLLNYQSKQSRNNLLISNKNAGDYLVKSKIKGTVYQMNIAKGEVVNPQTPIAIIGAKDEFLLEMQIDEYDIVSMKLGLPVIVVLNSYKDSVFYAVVSKINPIMNLQNKTFTLEATFVDPPSTLYPNISFEANVLLRTKKDALLIPRNYLLNDSTVVTKAGEKRIVKTGLRDFQMVEILSGIDVHESIILPEQ